MKTFQILENISHSLSAYYQVFPSAEQSLFVLLIIPPKIIISLGIFLCICWILSRWDSAKEKVSQAEKAMSE